jgi:hypothetical protein
MADQDLLKIRVTADFKEAEGAFLKLSRTATTFEKDINRVSASLNKEFNKIVGSAELFGDATNVVKDKMDALKNAMVSLLTMGFQPMNPEVQKLKAQYDNLAQSLDNTTNATQKSKKNLDESSSTIKKSNQQWTNWALVLQDLPYGFRGIQNNLPALMGGIAGMAGPLYLVGSAIIALFTAWDQGSFKAKDAIDRVAEAHKRTNEVLTKGAEEEAKAIVEMKKMAIVFDGVRSGSISANDALKTYNETYGETWGIAKNVNEAEDSFIKKSGAYVKAMALRAMANEKYAQAQEAFKAGKLAAGEDRTSFLIKLAAGMDALDKVGIMGFDPAMLTKLAKNFTKNYIESQKVAVNDIINSNASSFDLLMAQGAALDKEANKQLSGVGIKPTGKGKKETVTKPVLKQDDSLLKSLKAEEQLYRDDMYMKRAIGLEILKEEERLSVEKATFEKASDAVLLNIAKEFKFKRLAVEKELTDGINEINNAAADQKAKEQTEANKIAFDLAKAAKNRELQNALDAIKIESDTRQKFHKKDRAQIQQDLNDEKDALMDLAATGIWTAEQFDKITDALARVDAAIAGNKAHLKDFSVDWIDTMNNINGVIMDFINNSIYALADSLGKVLAGDTVDMVSVFGNLIADALQAIGKQLIAFATAWLFTFALMANPNPVSAGLALAAGIAAVAIGSLIKSSINKKPQASPPKFANGGIISGPTYGLMGEYPGAKSNPEIVAPLDKLKSMIGGGGSGEFVLRGNDLVLALQRSNSSLTLRR